MVGRMGTTSHLHACSAFILALTLMAVPPTAQAGATGAAPVPATGFDGVWQTTLSCGNFDGALGFSFRFASTVKNGVLHGEKGTPHEAGWLQIDGPVNADGAADLYVEGLVGAAPYAVGGRPSGTAYGYHVAARFEAVRAEGHRVEGRPCSVIWIRETGMTRAAPSIGQRGRPGAIRTAC